MQESDITKMKVADLKRELKNRGMSTFGNKNELIERLQAALVDGIEADELLDESVLTDEDEANILGDDENELLQSPTSLQIKLNTAATKDEDDLLLSPTSITAPKKIVLKRKNSFKDLEETHTTKENTQPTAESKVMKMSERNPIIVATETAIKTDAKGNVGKWSLLSEKERLEMRAKKFGVSSAVTTSTAATATTTITPNTSNEQMEKLKKRAERFGIVSPTIAKIDENERLLKRKERFGAAAETKSTEGTGNSNDWAEKARQRLERFKTAAASTAQK